MVEAERIELFPLYLKLDGRPCLVVGAGNIAAPKIDSLLRAGACVTVVAPEARVDVAQLAASGRLDWHQRRFEEADLEGIWLVITGTDDKSTNH